MSRIAVARLSDSAAVTMPSAPSTTTEACPRASSAVMTSDSIVSSSGACSDSLAGNDPNQTACTCTARMTRVSTRSSGGTRNWASTRRVPVSSSTPHSATVDPPWLMPNNFALIAR